MARFWAAFVASFVCVALGSTDLQVYRMIQVDLEGSSHGTRSASTNFNLDKNSFFSFDALDAEFIENISRPSFRSKGMLFMLPSTASMTPAMRTKAHALEALFLTKNFSFPIYFAEESSELHRIYDEVTSESPRNTFEKFLLATRGSPSQISPAKIHSIQGWLRGNSYELPSIVFVAHYDSLGLVPELSVGANRPTSGVIALLELNRILSRFYSDPHTRPQLNIGFLLTGGSAMDFAGIREWAKAHRKNIYPDTVVCLDSLMTEGLALHYTPLRPSPPDVNEAESTTATRTPPPSPEEAMRLVQSLQNVAAEMGISLETGVLDLPPEGNLTGFPQHHFPHQAIFPHFDDKVVVGMTLSSPDLQNMIALNRANFVDNSVDMPLLVRNIKFLARAVISFASKGQLSKLDEEQVPAAKISEELIAQWSSFLTGPSGFGRASPYVDVHHPALLSFQKWFSELAKNVSIETHSVSATPTSPLPIFYLPISRPSVIHLTRPYAFHVGLTFVAILYNGLLFLCLHPEPVFTFVKKLFHKEKKTTKEKEK